MKKQVIYSDLLLGDYKTLVATCCKTYKSGKPWIWGHHHACLSLWTSRAYACNFKCKAHAGTFVNKPQEMWRYQTGVRVYQNTLFVVGGDSVCKDFVLMGAGSPKPQVLTLILQVSNGQVTNRESNDMYWNVMLARFWLHIYFVMSVWCLWRAT